ncbi:MAG: hypothetical protein M3Q97_06775, partial [Bacteroidota bacterium]|nr:hypothetical protein [Bacteroidota bacterium]
RYIDLSGLAESDSVYLSFFYQRGGRGDEPEDYDSLLVQFHPDSLWTGFNWDKNAWVTVWSTLGGENGDFEQAIVGVKGKFQSNFFHDGFQFRFLAYGNRTGNIDHWHVDYVYMDKDRNYNDSSYPDLAIYYPTVTILKDFTSMPWGHVREDVNSYLVGDLPIYAKNNQAFAPQARYYFRVENAKSGFEYANTRPLNHVSNIEAFADTIFREPLDFSIIPAAADTVKLNIITAVRNRSITESALFRNNDSCVFTQVFANYYAYDDGVADAGYGLINAKAGKAALQFALAKADTLQGVHIYFNRSEADVSLRRFNLVIWKSISPRGEISDRDSVIYKVEFLRPQYRDTLNGFAYFPLDSAFLVSGTIYVGWEQTTDYVLNVGLDNNFRQNVSDSSVVRLHYNVAGRWQHSDVSGIPMI